jgi:hypothetical protein
VQDHHDVSTVEDVHAKDANQDDEPTNDYKHGRIVTGKPEASWVEEDGFLRPSLSYRRQMTSLEFIAKWAPSPRSYCASSYQINSN